MRTYSKQYIGGAWVDPAQPRERDVIDSTTEQVIGSAPLGSATDSEEAAAAAAAAWQSWADTPVAERADFLDTVAEGINQRIGEFAEVFSQEVGMIAPMALSYQQAAAAMFAQNAQIARGYTWEQPQDGWNKRYEPIGVVGAITPWNYPLVLAAAKVAPALAVGCTVVLKPSEVTPLTSFMLAEIFDAAGVPAGVFNVVGGTGPETGEALVASPLVDMISFTGSTRAGRRIAAVAAETVKRVTLELGGKSACVVLDDGDLKAAVTTAMGIVTENSGQGCGALSRLIVPRGRVAEAEELARQWCQSALVGDPAKEETTMGPLSSAEHFKRVRDYIQQGIDEGLTLVAGGLDMPEGLSVGYFVRPTVFSSPDNNSTLAREEIFGPVEVIIPHDGDEDALRIANDSIYGLGGAVFGADPERAGNFARHIRAGKVDINGYVISLSAPWGGYKQSGLGRQNDVLGFEEFLEIKALTAHG
jgi:acyl-CoA reductase-like NAD-dependent aldehyde dehydrogenase